MILFYFISLHFVLFKFSLFLSFCMLLKVEHMVDQSHELILYVSLHSHNKFDRNETNTKWTHSNQ